MSQCKPWWKEPWPWLLISGPALAMIGCAVTIWVALRHADRPIVDGVVRQGLVIRQTAATSAPATPGGRGVGEGPNARTVARP
ncbi:FixH family protein [Cupriavidus sp. JZ107]